MCLPAHDVTVIFATFKMFYEQFHGAKLLHSAYLSEILLYERYLIFCCQCPLKAAVSFIFIYIFYFLESVL